MHNVIVPPPIIASVCLSVSVAYIGPNSRTERPRRTEIGTEVAHVTRDSDTTFKVKRSNVKVTRPLYKLPCWRVKGLQRRAWERVAVGNCCYIAVCSAAQGASAPTGEERSGGISCRPPAYSLLFYYSTMCMRC